MPRPVVLCFVSYFAPGFKAGGPIRSLLGLFGNLGADFDFRVVTRNHDLGVPQPYVGRDPGEWYEAGGARVTYLRRPCWNPVVLVRIVRTVRPDLIFIHSGFDPAISIMPMLLRRTGFIDRRIPVLIAPHGELAASALGFKGGKKALYSCFARLAGVYRGVFWLATDASEAAMISAHWGAGAKVLVASSLPPKRASTGSPARPRKVAGGVRLVFLSRIVPMKNLVGALDALRDVRSAVVFDIYGSQEDRDYWSECERRIQLLPANVRVAYRGVVRPDEVAGVLSSYDVFFLPTLGENFGYAILEALLAGCPLIISDRTPWRDLAGSGAGFDLPLERQGALAAAVEAFAAMDDEAFRVWSDRARRLGEDYCGRADLVAAARSALETAMAVSPGAAPR